MGALLEPGGLALLQAITIEDHRYAQALREVDFIKRHVFPGASFPRCSAMLEAKTPGHGLEPRAASRISGSPMRARSRPGASASSRSAGEVRALGFDDHFIRLWDFYLAYCEGGFRERSIGVAHLHVRQGRPALDAGFPE